MEICVAALVEFGQALVEFHGHGRARLVSQARLHRPTLGVLELGVNGRPNHNRAQK
jgi:hypothetical protein